MVEPGRSFKEQSDVSLGRRTDRMAGHEGLNYFAGSNKGRKGIRPFSSVIVEGKHLSTRGVALPTNIATSNEQMSLILVRQKNQFCVGGLGNKHAFSKIPVVEVTHLFTLSVIVAGLQIAPSIGQNDLVTASSRKLPKQSMFKEGDINSVGQDECMIPGTLQLVWYA
ncbi:MAG TPA: hypothetical protein VKR06_12010 [Ktedonosporobacter sp.]|nr:hypothetical protein [Ktedonosporobacter sp.]